MHTLLITALHRMTQDRQAIVRNQGFVFIGHVDYRDVTLLCY
jgi:hypothetical protein